MRTINVVAGVLALCVTASQAGAPALAAQSGKAAQSKPAAAKYPADHIDEMIAPVALYPDQLLAQLLIATTIPARVVDCDKWLKSNPGLTGTALQDAAKQKGYDPPLVLLVLFPQVIDFLAVNLEWTTEVGHMFTADRAGVLDGIQRMRADAMTTGKLKTTAKQSVTLKTVGDGKQVIVIEPVNPQVVYVPQYNSQQVYSQAPATTTTTTSSTTTVIIKEEDDDDAEAVAAGMIGFTAGIAIGAAVNNNYYYGPYGWHGSPYMYNDAWNDYYDDRQDAREDFYDNREDAREDLADHREDMAENRGDRASNTQEQRTQRQENRQESGRSVSSSAASSEARGQNRDRASTATERSGTRSDAFSGYSSGKSERSASSRGSRSRSSSGGGGRRR